MGFDRVHVGIADRNLLRPVVGDDDWPKRASCAIEASVIRCRNSIAKLSNVKSHVESQLGFLMIAVWFFVALSVRHFVASGPRRPEATGNWSE